MPLVKLLYKLFTFDLTIAKTESAVYPTDNYAQHEMYASHDSNYRAVWLKWNMMVRTFLQMTTKISNNCIMTNLQT